VLAKSLPSRENYSARGGLDYVTPPCTDALSWHSDVHNCALTYVTMRAISSRHTLIELHIWYLKSETGDDKLLWMMITSHVCGTALKPCRGMHVEFRPFPCSGVAPRAHHS
jgi:hypothetical protein